MAAGQRSDRVTVFTNGCVVLADSVLDDGYVIVQNGLITAVGRRGDLPNSFLGSVVDQRNLAGNYIVPGFVDIHVHGGGGADFMDGEPAAVERAIETHARHGTTSLFPTTTTGSQTAIQAMLGAVSDCQSRWNPQMGSRISGVHLYGPYFAADKVGCHDPQGRRNPTLDEYAGYFDSGLVRVATCAAELDGAAAFYSHAARHGCLVTCGHSNASWSEMEAAFQHGMRHVDHFWCAMSSVVSLRTRLGTPMQASMEQFVLANSHMSTEVIADGCHLADELLRFAYQMKGSDKLCLVTDASRALDMPAGNYSFGNRYSGPVFWHDGQVGRTLDGKGLASSTAGMDRMVRNMWRATGAPLWDVIKMASLTPAKLTGIADQVGSIEAGKRADFVILDRELQVLSTILDGVASEVW